MLSEFEEVLSYYRWYPSTHMIPRVSYLQSGGNIYFIPKTYDGGIFVEWKGKGHKPIVVCEYSSGKDCLLNILKYSGKTYEDWINVLINRNEQEIQELIDKNKELEQEKLKYDNN